MLHAHWMEHDERTPEQIRQDRLRSLRHEDTDLTRRLEKVRADIAALVADQRQPETKP